MNLENSIRAYLKIFKEPFIDERNGKIFEWENNENVRFRAVADKIANNYSEKITEFHQRGGSQPPLSPFDEVIITFYSDINLKERMEFKNPLVKEYYKRQNQNDTFILYKVLVELLEKEGLC
ncbi:hypothetical protein [Campylobacter cuniculorum]|uniref:Uncharacterized protein n=1 Tax=Campylobacter cuniculorum TaxID=374106 RepID=A0ABX6TV98_9BACT|nr:hypothetical protein [Campylobacter cuniculorum]QOR03630.1 hypothetical protein A0071_05375 [Campylobacter cuniculorum]